MARFSLFRTPKPQKFNYIPRHYDADQEELHARIRAAKQEGKSDQSPEAIKARMQMGFRQRQSIDRKFQRKQQTRANYRVVGIAFALTCVAAYLIWRNLESIVGLMQ